MTENTNGHEVDATFLENLFGKNLLKYNETTKKMEDFTTKYFVDISRNSESTSIIGLYITPQESKEDCRRKNDQTVEDLFRITNERKLYHFEIVLVTYPLKFGNIENIKKNNQEDVIEQPWFIIPDIEIEKKIRIRHKFEVRDGESSLVLLDSRDGSTITIKALDEFSEDPTALNFPWMPPKLADLLRKLPSGLLCPPNDFSIQEEGEYLGEPLHKPFQELVENGILGIYFSAKWCPPCKAFTTQLAKTYKKIKQRGNKFEVIFVSSDRSEESFNEHCKNMPWLAIPYGELEVRRSLTKLYDVHGIPSIVIAKADGTVITADGRGEITDDPDARDFPWWPKSVNILTTRLAAKLHTKPAVVLFIDGHEDSEIELAEDVLQPISERVRKEYKHLDLQFFVSIDCETGESVREYANFEDESPLLTIIDIPCARTATMEYGKEITEKAVMDFVNSFLRNTIKFDLL